MNAKALILVAVSGLIAFSVVSANAAQRMAAPQAGTFFPQGDARGALPTPARRRHGRIAALGSKRTKPSAYLCKAAPYATIIARDCWNGRQGCLPEHFHMKVFYKQL
ncbi:MAG: hypothetical protein DI549_10675 [Ancylobacter novellus]|uniref:Uncharacterized protein n=1 Tax=Ancylobacter novellus TaxID=921 RepID=A0A2W5R1Z0_ANCNO|nr:MAG: hypothetical protein DI549_10675 [Ancylobacter novellus]